LSGALAVSNGGTGQTTASAAISDLGGMSLSANNTNTGSNVFSLLQVLGTATSCGLYWTTNIGGGNAGLLSPEDGNFALYPNAVHGTSGNAFPGGGNGVEWQL